MQQLGRLMAKEREASRRGAQVTSAERDNLVEADMVEASHKREVKAAVSRLKLLDRGTLFCKIWELGT